MEKWGISRVFRRRYENTPVRRSFSDRDSHLGFVDVRAVGSDGAHGDVAAGHHFASCDGHHLDQADGDSGTCPGLLGQPDSRRVPRRVDRATRWTEWTAIRRPCDRQEIRAVRVGQDDGLRSERWELQHPELVSPTVGQQVRRVADYRPTWRGQGFCPSPG